MFSISLSTREKLANHLLWVGALGAGTLVGAHDAQAQFTLPTGLAAGSTYRLAFVTSGTIAATSTDIATYNSFVNAQAALNNALPTTNWFAIASTATTSAANNIACGGTCATDPVYLVTGTEVVASAANLFAATTNGSIALMSAIDVTQTNQIENSIYNTYVWTGSLNDGSSNITSPLGSAYPQLGGTWTNYQDYINFSTGDSSAVPYYLYAISGELTVPAAVPEPGSAPLMASGLMLAAGLVWRRYARKSV